MTRAPRTHDFQYSIEIIYVLDAVFAPKNSIVITFNILLKSSYGDVAVCLIDDVSILSIFY